MSPVVLREKVKSSTRRLHLLPSVQPRRRRAMSNEEGEGSDPAARRAAEEWRKRFGREGHEGSYAQHDDEAAPAEVPAKEPSRTSE